MTKFVGRVADIGIAIETTRGTAESSATYWLPKMSLTLDDKVDVVPDESSVGVIEDATDTKVVKQYAEGEFEGKIGANSIGVLLLATLGTVSTSGPAETSVYTHTFTVQQDAQHDSVTILQDDPNQDYSYPLGMITSFNLEAALEEFVKVTVGFRSKGGDTASHTPSYSAEDNFLPQHIIFKTASAQSGLAGASEIAVRSVTMNINKNVEDDHNLGDLEATDILNKQFSCEGTIELVFNSNDFKTEMLADTAEAMRIEMVNDDVTIGSTLNPKLTFDLYKVKYSEVSRNYDNDEIVILTVNYKALYSLTDSKMLDAVLINEVSSY